MRTFMMLISTLLLSSAAFAQQSSYPRGELLVEPDQLMQSIDDQPFVILDVRPKEQYQEGHLPGALWIDADLWKQKFDSGNGADEWAERIGALGISRQSKVVIYDDSSAKDAARIWWILRFWGVDDTRLLNGGWTGWQAANGPAQQEIPAAPSAVEFQPNPSGRRLATSKSVLEALDDQSLQIIDARSESEFCGLEPLNNQRAGAIPGAKNLEWSDLIDDQTQRFKPADELRRLFDAAGIDLDKPSAAHCQSGGRSSVMVFAMELMGASRVQNYYAGWSEWGNLDDTPVTKPEPRED